MSEWASWLRWVFFSWPLPHLVNDKVHTIKKVHSNYLMWFIVTVAPGSGHTLGRADWTRWTSDDSQRVCPAAVNQTSVHLPCTGGESASSPHHTAERESERDVRLSAGQRSTFPSETDHHSPSSLWRTTLWEDLFGSPGNMGDVVSSHLDESRREMITGNERRVWAAHRLFVTHWSGFSYFCSDPKQRWNFLMTTLLRFYVLQNSWLCVGLSCILDQTEVNCLTWEW